MTILITGGLGFIGTSVALTLVKQNYKVLLYDIRDNNKGEKIYENYNNIHFIKGDTNDTNLLKEIFNTYHIKGVIHLAAVSRVAIAQQNKEECVRTNLEGTVSLLNAIKKTNTTQKPWLIFGSSREVYGEPKELPVKESFEKKHVNIYGKTKIEGETMFLEFANEHKCSCLILRFANVYGNRFDLLDRVIPRFIKAIAHNKPITIEGGNQLIDFTHIDDTVDTIIKSINYINNNKGIINDFHILPAIGWSLHQAISYIEEFTGNKAIQKVNQKRNYDVEKFVGDDSKIKNLLKSRSFLTLKEGIQKSIKVYS